MVILDGTLIHHFVYPQNGVICGAYMCGEAFVHGSHIGFRSSDSDLEWLLLKFDHYSHIDTNIFPYPF
jgi:hypothetical protein